MTKLSLTKNPGRPSLKPTSVQREDVRLFKADGWSDHRIARRLGISRPTLLKHFAEELENGADEERHAALRLLKKAASKLNVSAIRDYLKLIDRNQAQDRHLEQPDRLTKPKTGKKEIALEEARRAHHDSDWGDDLAPLEDRSLN